MILTLENKFTSLRNAFNSSEKYVCITAGRRSGKTFEAFDWLYHELLMGGATSALWIDTVQGNIEKYVERYCKTRLKPIWHLCSWNGQRKVLTLPNKHFIDFGSAERPENLEGFEYHRVIINEAGIALKKAGLWDNTIYPMTKGNNKTRIIGTPKSQNKFFELSQKYKHIHFTAYDSPYWDKEELETIKASIPSEVWRQEYLAEFLEGAGTVFRNIMQCIKLIDKKEGNIMAVDLAKHQDFTVIMVGDSSTKEVIHIDRFNQIDWQFQKKRIYDTWLRYGKPKCIIDSTGVGDAIYDDLNNFGMQLEPFKFTSTSKNEIIQNLSVAMDNQEIYFPNNEILINELEIFGYDVSPSGNLRYNAPEGHHDDTVVTLAMLNKLMNSEKELFFTLL